MVASTTSRTIEIVAGATICADWMDGIESTLHANVTVEATLTGGRWVYQINGRAYSCDISSDTFRWV